MTWNRWKHRLAPRPFLLELWPVLSFFRLPAILEAFFGGRILARFLLLMIIPPLLLTAALGQPFQRSDPTEVSEQTSDLGGADSLKLPAIFGILISNVGKIPEQQVTYLSVLMTYCVAFWISEKNYLFYLARWTRPFLMSTIVTLGYQHLSLPFEISSSWIAFWFVLLGSQGLVTANMIPAGSKMTTSSSSAMWRVRRDMKIDLERLLNYQSSTSAPSLNVDAWSAQHAECENDRQILIKVSLAVETINRKLRSRTQREAEQIIQRLREATTPYVNQDVNESEISKELSFNLWSVRRLWNV